MTRPEAPPVPPSPDEEEAVIEFLRRNPDFFARHTELLAEMPVRHATGPAVSLMEKQVDVLRDRNTRLQQRLDLLLHTARANETRVVSTNSLARNLITADSFTGVLTGLAASLKGDFDIDAVAVGLFGRDQPLLDGLLWLPRDPVPAPLNDFFRQCITRCGSLPESLRELLFPANPELRSAAMVPLDREQPLGVLAIASADPELFNEGMGTMFLELTAGLAAAALRHHWPADDAAAG